MFTRCPRIGCKGKLAGVMTREYADPDDPLRSIIVRVRECTACPRLVESEERITNSNRSTKWLPKTPRKAVRRNV
jgi:hypothetical protein